MFIYDPENVAVVRHLVNGKEGVAIQWEADDVGFGTDDYNGDALYFEDPSVAAEWISNLAEAAQKVCT